MLLAAADTGGQAAVNPGGPVAALTREGGGTRIALPFGALVLLAAFGVGAWRELRIR
jgi:hypothetical protein